MSMSNELKNLKAESAREKENFFIRFFKYFLPWKGDDFSEIIRKLVFAASIVVFCFSLSDLSEYLNGNAKTNELIEEMQSMKPAINQSGDAQSVEHAGGVSGDGTYAPGDNGNIPDQPAVIGENWKALLDINEDVVGWISIDTFRDPDGQMYIDYPVVKGKDNDYYLSRDIKNNYSGSGGTIFMDYASSIVPGERTDNVTIFGHNMKAGTFFGRLSQYKSGVDFLKANPLITFNTLYSTSEEKYIIVYCSMFNVLEEQDNGIVFRYVGYRDFTDEHSFETWKEEVSKRSWYSSDIDINEDDDFLTLSTCSSDISNMRWVIVARKVRPDDDIDALVQTYKERDDSEVYFPQRWIRSWGNKKVHRN